VGFRSLRVKCREIPTLFTPSEIPDKQSHLPDEVLAVFVRVHSGVPPISDGRDHGAPYAGLVNEQHPFVMAIDDRAIFTRRLFTIEGLKDARRRIEYATLSPRCAR